MMGSAHKGHNLQVLATKPLAIKPNTPQQTIMKHPFIFCLPCLNSLLDFETHFQPYLHLCLCKRMLILCRKFCVGIVMPDRPTNSPVTFSGAFCNSCVKMNKSQCCFQNCKEEQTCILQQQSP